MKRALLAIALLCASAPAAFAQQAAFGSTNSPVVNNLGVPIPGANIAVCQPLATTAASVTSNVAVLTMASNPVTAGFTAGMTIQVAGFTGGDTYLNVGSFTNGTGITSGATILSVTTSTITFTLTHGNASASSNGTVLQQGNANTPCAGLSSLTSDAAGQVSLTQPLSTDAYGNWNGFAPAATYYLQFYGQGVALKFNQVVIGAPPILAALDQTGVSSANSGTPQNILASTPWAGNYRISVYADQSAGCATVGSGALTVSLQWTDATHARTTSNLTLTPGTAATGTGSFVTSTINVWAASGTAITVTDTFTACMTGSWTYDQHATVEQVAVQ